MFAARSLRSIVQLRAPLNRSADRFTASIPGTRRPPRVTGGDLPSRSIVPPLSFHYSTTPTSRSSANESYSSSNGRNFLWAAAVAAGILSTVLVSQPLLAEEANDKKKEDGKAGPPFTKEQIGVICIIGGPSSGKSTQLKNASERFNLITLDAKKQDLKQEIEKLVSEKKGDEKVRVIIEGFPKTIEQANKFQDEVVPILLIISIVLDAPKGIDRVKGDESLRRDAKINWKRFEDASEGLIKQFRFQGNILEITGEWPKDEVWEQVEAKLESALELDDRGEL